MRERPIATVPRSVLLTLSLGLLLQICWHNGQPITPIEMKNLPSPPSLAMLRIASFGEPIALAKLLMLQLQSFDMQSGTAYPLLSLDYTNVEMWLHRILELDPPAQYPLLAASRLYGEVPNPAKQRQMLEFVYQKFLVDPNHRWPWLAHAALIAKHRLKDLPLARKYAQAIRLYATDSTVPHWATQMEVFILEDMDEQESAKILLGGLLKSQQITDPHELQFLTKNLMDISDAPPPNAR
jgi:hypothetical protein